MNKKILVLVFIGLFILVWFMPLFQGVKADISIDESDIGRVDAPPEIGDPASKYNFIPDPDKPSIWMPEPNKTLPTQEISKPDKLSFKARLTVIVKVYGYYIDNNTVSPDYGKVIGTFNRVVESVGQDIDISLAVYSKPWLNPNVIKVIEGVRVIIKLKVVEDIGVESFMLYLDLDGAIDKTIIFTEAGSIELNLPLAQYGNEWSLTIKPIHITVNYLFYKGGEEMRGTISKGLWYFPTTFIKIDVSFPRWEDKYIWSGTAVKVSWGRGEPRG